MRGVEERETSLYRVSGWRTLTTLVRVVWL
jgi:hypothetical protein